MTAKLRTALLSAMLIGSVPTVLVGQKPSVDSLLRRIDSLERKVADLELRLRAVETRTGAGQVQYPPIPAAPSQQRPIPTASKWRDLANWRQLRRGMTEKQVRDLLGEPERVVGGGFTFWYWPDAQVSFYENKVEGWSEPGR